MMKPIYAILICLTLSNLVLGFRFQPLSFDIAGGTSASFSHNGELILTVGLNAVRVFDAHSGQPLKLKLPNANPGLAIFSPDDKKIKVATKSSIGLFDVVTGNEALKVDTSQSPSSAAFSPDGKNFVAAFFNYARVWDGTSGKEKLTLAHPGADLRCI